MYPAPIGEVTLEKNECPCDKPDYCTENTDLCPDTKYTAADNVMCRAASTDPNEPCDADGGWAGVLG